MFRDPVLTSAVLDGLPAHIALIDRSGVLRWTNRAWREFGELNGAHPIFVEDAVRLLCASLESDPRIGDFRVVASHQESLHSHDAVSILTKGDTFKQASYDPRLFDSLYHVG